MKKTFLSNWNDTISSWGYNMLTCSLGGPFFLFFFFRTAAVCSKKKIIARALCQSAGQTKPRETERARTQGVESILYLSNFKTFVIIVWVFTYFSVSSLYSPILQEKSTICDKTYNKETEKTVI